MKDLYWHYKESLPLKFCNEVINFAKTQQSSLGQTGNQGKNTKQFKKRKSNIVWLDEPWIMKVIVPFIDHANKSLGLNYKIDTSEIPQFTIYEVGQYYGWHQDQWPKPYSQDHNISRLRGKNRKLSSTISLNSKTDYKGGDLQFAVDSNNSPKRQTLSVDLSKTGSMVVFPSDTWHRVTPVTTGVRYSLVLWSVGEPLR